MTINIKIINIFLFILIFLATAGIVSGADAEIDENSMNTLRDLYLYEKDINEMRHIVDDLKLDVKKGLNEIEEYKSNYAMHFEDIISMNNEIERLRFYNGFTDVRGPGIMIRVSDSKSDDVNIDIMEKIIHDVDIAVLINDLKNAGAEAIDVNNKRIINISEVVCAGPLLKINGSSVSAPFIIKAIGDKEKLYEQVTTEGTYAYELKNKYGMEVTTIMSYDLQVPKFHGNKHDAKFTQIID